MPLLFKAHIPLPFAEDIGLLVFKTHNFSVPNCDCHFPFTFRSSIAIATLRSKDILYVLLIFLMDLSEPAIQYFSFYFSLWNP